VAPIDATAAALARPRAAVITPQGGPPLRVCLLGFGNVGQALARLLAAQPALGTELQVVAVADRKGIARAPGGHDLEPLLAVKAAGRSIGFEPSPESLAEFVADLDCDVVVDALPSNLDTGEPSRSIALSALRSGKHVVTANKGLLAQHGAEALAVSEECGRTLRSGAAVGGGTPVLELLSDAFRGDKVLRFEAVLNGSTNFLLCELERGATWDAALKKARDRGILEADPSLDLSGRDAAAKAVILANSLWALGWRLQDARVQGIWGLGPGEAKDALVHGLAIRLLVRADPEGGVRVAPVALPREHPLVLEGTENAVRFTLRSAGTVTIRGPGAGGMESASKVLSDLLAIAGQAR
jgi:homoserine dehydrogenase